MLITNLILIILFYFLGSIPFGYLLTKIFGFGDIRNIGSGNVGATNVLRTGNKYLAFIVLFLDMIKGMVPFIIINLYFSNMELINTIFLCHFAIIGHIFPIWLKFKGGKGVATYIGFLFGMNLYIGLFFLLVWLFVSLLSKYSSLSSILASILVPIFIVFFNSNSYIIIFLSYLSLVIILKHKENIRRLLNKTENKIKLFH